MCKHRGQEHNELVLEERQRKREIKFVNIFLTEKLCKVSGVNHTVWVLFAFWPLKNNVTFYHQKRKE